MANPRSSRAAPLAGRCAACVGARAGKRRGSLRGRGPWLLALLLGCGARALVDASPDEEEFGTSGAGGRGGAAGRGGGGRAGVGAAPTIDPTAPIDLGGVMLPDCEPGFSMSAAGSRQCSYLYRGDCYEDPFMACACACQSFADNRGCIIGGFLNPDEPQRVSCVQR